MYAEPIWQYLAELDLYNLYRYFDEVYTSKNRFFLHILSFFHIHVVPLHATYDLYLHMKAYQQWLNQPP